MLTPEQLLDQISRFPRLSYGAYPTPLEPLDNLSTHIRGPRLWIKRDDGLGPAMGGNKARKLEFLIPIALARGMRKVVTYGGLGSNHVRMTAAACAALGLEAHLFFFERRPAKLSGNLLLDRLFDAHMHFIPLDRGGNGSMTIETTNRLVRLFSMFYTGPRAFFIPVGGHTATGCIGYVNCALELHQQCMELELLNRPTTVVTACGTGGTFAGLLAGFHLLDSPINVVGIDIGKLWKSFRASLVRLTGDICHALGQSYSFRAEHFHLIEGKYVGPGYAQSTDESDRAIRKMAQNEGILLDPVYTGKAFAGLLDLILKGQFGSDENVIFLHTGGAPGLWAMDPSVS